LRRRSRAKREVNRAKLSAVLDCRAAKYLGSANHGGIFPVSTAALIDFAQGRVLS
jgi:hypothetical protein